MARGLICRVAKVVPLCRNWEAVYPEGRSLPAPARRDSYEKGQTILFFEATESGETATYSFKGVLMRGSIDDPSIYDLDDAPINSHHEVDR